MFFIIPDSFHFLVVILDFSALHDAHRTACLRHDEQGQVEQLCICFRSPTLHFQPCAAGPVTRSCNPADPLRFTLLPILDFDTRHWCLLISGGAIESTHPELLALQHARSSQQVDVESELPGRCF